MEGENRLRDRDSPSLRTTRWSLVQRAALGASKDLNEWARASWYPLYAWARQKNWSPEDAADAVQDFMGKICNKGLLRQVDPARGRFRSWLLAGFSNHLSSRQRHADRLKRGGGMKHVPVDRQLVETFYQTDMTDVVDANRAFSRAWALTLMDEALTRLAAHYHAGDRGDLFEVLLPALEEPLAETTYRESAAGLGLSGPALRQAAVRFRQRYRRLLLDVAGERLGVTCEARLAEELRELLGQ
jgi:DNA-directed RNA polymerase specialized sigma24 family protein